MTAATMTDTAVVPLSEFRGDLRDFMMRLRYDRDNTRGRRRFEGDHLLLSRFRDLAMSKNHFGVTHAEAACVADMGEQAIRDAVEDVEDELFERRWRLSGDDEQPILERLDAHFAGPQAAWVEEQHERQALAEVRAREAAERHLDELRGGIGLARESVRETERQIALMETDLAGVAAELGVEAWPGA